MATLTVYTSDRDTGVNLTDNDVAANAGGDQFAGTGREKVYLDNASGGAITVTAVTQKTIDGEAVADKTLSVPAAERMIWGPFPTDWYNDSNDMVQLTYSGVTSLTVCVFKD